MTTLKRHGGWRSATVAEGYIEESINNKIEIAKKIQGVVSVPERAVVMTEPISSSGQHLEAYKVLQFLNLQKKSFNVNVNLNK